MYILNRYLEIVFTGQINLSLDNGTKSRYSILWPMDNLPRRRQKHAHEAEFIHKENTHIETLCFKYRA